MSAPLTAAYTLLLSQHKFGVHTQEGAKALREINKRQTRRFLEFGGSAGVTLMGSDDKSCGKTMTQMNVNKDTDLIVSGIYLRQLYLVGPSTHRFTQMWWTQLKISWRDADVYSGGSSNSEPSHFPRSVFQSIYVKERERGFVISVRARHFHLWYHTLCSSALLPLDPPFRIRRQGEMSSACSSFPYIFSLHSLTHLAPIYSFALQR